MNFDALKPVFGGLIRQSQIDGINAISAAWTVMSGRPDIKQQQAYVLATAAWETAHSMQPIREYGLGHGHTYGAVDSTGKAPYGRGYVQLTWAHNYQRADTELGLKGALAHDYDLALDPTIASKIIVRGMIDGWFTGVNLGMFIHGPVADFVDARRIINGLDRAEIVAAYAKAFVTALT